MLSSDFAQHVLTVKEEYTLLTPSVSFSVDLFQLVVL